MSPELTLRTPPATVDLRGNGSNGPITINYGDALTLSWTSINATFCAITTEAGNRPANGSLILYNRMSSGSYNIICTGPGGTGTDSVSFNINSNATSDVDASWEEDEDTMTFN